MKKFLSVLVSALVGLTVSAQVVLSPFKGIDNVFVFRNTVEDNEFGMRYVSAVYLVYPDSRCTLEQAQALVDEMGFSSGEIWNNLGAVAVVNPVGETYDAKEDFDAYESLFNALFVHLNVKIVGVGRGATFVNTVLSPVAGEVAGIVSIDGKAPAHAIGKATVPVYVAGKNTKSVARYYRDVNSSSDDPLLKVALCPASVKGLKAIMEDAWDRLLCRNMRSSNYGHTSYMGERLGQYPFELQEYAYPPALGLRKMVVDTNVYAIPGKNYLWFEYFNSRVETAPSGSVPLVVLLHGNHNDPRTQAETSGYLPLAATEDFMVIELEWQGGKDGGHSWMGLDGIELVINSVLEKYPQLDRSRVYAQGLSAGAFTTTALGIHKPYLFAAVAAQSGGVVNTNIGERAIMGTGYNRESLFADAMSRRGSILMPYFSISGTADVAIPHPSHMDVSDLYPAGIPMEKEPALEPEESYLFKAWQLYQTINGASVVERFDSSTDVFFGQELQGRTSFKSGDFTLHQGDVVVNGIPVMRLVTVENFGHWNFYKAARMEWEYFRHFSRDPRTKKLVYTE